jgi:Mg2+ and Co2+ transporter CorA
MKLPTLFTRFSINTGEVDPDLCTSSIGLQPTKVLKKGQERPAPRPTVLDNRWDIETSRRQIYSIDESLIELLKVIWPKRDRIISFCRENNVDCSFVTAVWASEEHRPVYDLSRDTIKKIAALGASWIMDAL